ncbi:MAG: ATP-binding protein, partial [Gammaproteobacteria bacterium]|nr:ATP-binding protein [Gammaproteobacteria bacterium]
LITVTMPLSDIAVDLHEEFNSEFALTLLVYFLIVAAIALLIFRSKKVTDNLMSEVESKTDTLKNEIAYRQKAELEHRRSEAMLSQILNTALDAIITVDIRGKIVKVNAASTVLFGYSNEELIGQAVEILMPTSFADMHQKILDKYVVTGNANVIGKTGRQLLGKRKNGELFPMFISVGEFEMEGERYFTSIIHDLTEMVAYQTELEHAKEVAERANQAKSIFLSSISHEVRTPLNAILGFAQLMQMDAQKYPLSEDQESAIKEIENAGNHLLAIITDLLDYSTYEVGNIALIKEDTNLFDLVNESLTIVSRMAVEKNVHLFATDALKNMGISVEVDRRRIKQVLINLLSNAIKYNRQGGTVDVECNYDEPNTAAKITIRDTGLGIAEDKLEHIYEPFNRVGAERSDIEGTGIGLAIVSRIVQKHDGIIEIDSTVGEGTTFVITLPNARKQILDTGTR